MVKWEIEVMDEWQTQALQSNWIMTREVIVSDGLMLAETESE